jgi:hypothetical protein
MTAEITCGVKDAVVQELLVLNNKLHTLSPDLLFHSRCKPQCMSTLRVHKPLSSINSRSIGNP